jgi:hypothetical protein
MGLGKAFASEPLCGRRSRNRKNTKRAAAFAPINKVEPIDRLGMKDIEFDDGGGNSRLSI